MHGGDAGSVTPTTNWTHQEITTTNTRHYRKLCNKVIGFLEHLRKSNPHDTSITAPLNQIKADCDRVKGAEQGNFELQYIQYADKDLRNKHGDTYIHFKSNSINRNNTHSTKRPHSARVKTEFAPTLAGHGTGHPRPRSAHFGGGKRRTTRKLRKTRRTKRHRRQSRRTRA